MISARMRRWIGAVLVLGAMGCSARVDPDQLACPGGAPCTFEDMWQIGETDTDTYYTTFPLSHGACPGTLDVRVDDNPVPESGIDGYTYDDDDRVIEFHGIWLPERGSTIRASYCIAQGT